MSHNVRQLPQPEVPQTQERVIRVEGIMITVLVGGLSIFASFTLNSIKESLHDTAGQVQVISTNISDIKSQVVGLTVGLHDMDRRVTNVENRQNPHQP